MSDKVQVKTSSDSPETFRWSGMLQRKCACGQHTIAGGECQSCTKEEAKLQRATRNSELETRNSFGIPPIGRDVLRSPGQPPDAATRAFFEPRFGHDFSRVPVHLGTPNAAALGIQKQASVFNDSDSPKDAGSGAPAPACVKPKSVSLDSTQTLEFPDYLTGGGICAVMRVDPAVDNLCPGITEQITAAPKGTCPESLIKGGLCQGGSTFPLGKAQGGACSSIKPKQNEFVDRHSVQLSSTSLLHDAERNPKGLKACQFTCNQEYYIQSEGKRVTLGQFEIAYDLSEGTREGKKITKVTATKSAKK